MWGAMAGGALGIASAIGTAAYNQQQQNKQMANLWKAGLAKYSGTIESNREMQAALDEYTLNMVDEFKRVGSANTREADLQANKAIGTTIASQQGITAGNSKARQLMELDVNRDKLLFNTDQKSQSMINKTLESRDQMTNNLNMANLQAYDELRGTLATNVSGTPLWLVGLQAAAGGAQGASAGAQITS